MQFAITFGSQYGPSRTIHPLAPFIDAESFVTLEAPNYDAGHEMAMRLTGGRFAFIYEFNADFRRQILEYTLEDRTSELLSWLLIHGRIHGVPVTPAMLGTE